MAAVDVGSRHVPPVPVDDLDNTFSYDINEDVLRDIDTNMDVAPIRPVAPTNALDPFAGALGLDEEIKISKKRAPIAKLDEDRLLSEAGIPKLRKVAKERIKFRGKGHEVYEAITQAHTQPIADIRAQWQYSDVAKMLNFYQLWLDDLYPRAKFADGLAIIEKLGHKKRIHSMRREWINEGKVRDTTQNVQEGRSGTPKTQTPSGNLAASSAVTTSAASKECNDGSSSIQARAEHQDESNELFLSDDDRPADVPEDDLDALLAEDDERPKMPGGVSELDAVAARPADSFDDEEEAMMGMGHDLW